MSDRDLRNFDKTFTNKTVKEKPADEDKSMKGRFEGFTFKDPSHL
jgi:hypothetical protein